MMTVPAGAGRGRALRELMPLDAFEVRLHGYMGRGLAWARIARPGPTKEPS